MDGTTYEQVAHRPAPPLDRFIERYVGYRMAGFPSGIHAGLPGRSITFVVSLGEPLELAAMPGPAQAPGCFESIVGGLHTSPARIRHDGNQHGIQLDVTPLGARALFGRPAADLARTVVELHDLLGADAGELIERVRTAATWTDRFAAFDRVLRRRIGDHGAPRPEVGRAWNRLQTTAGTVRIEVLARETGWSRRHLSEQFRFEFGLGPKAIGRVLRFERSVLLLRRPDAAASSLARLAADCGYADQAHLNRDWRQMAGLSPTAWLASEHLPFVQADPVPAGAR